MGQGYSLTSLSAGSAGIDIPELADLIYERSLGTARFMKSIRARKHNGLVFVKVIMKPYPSLKLDPYVKAIIRERNILEGIPNALAYQRILETGTGGYLVRQYIFSSLYDRMSTRPFLEDIEKKWMSFQLLCALRDCHSQNVFHGDIKTENVLVTSWNWLYLSDFSSSFKPTFLPEDNPADFSFYFDTSGRRTCYLAPERFLEAGEDPGSRSVNWAMDIFSAGCVIAELFLESPIFSLSQLYKYRKGEYDPKTSRLMEIEDPDIRELVLHMVQLNPESRYSADECLNFWRRKAFPEYFYSFLHQYMNLITEPGPGRPAADLSPGDLKEADERISRVFLDFDKISYFLGAPQLATKDSAKVTSPTLTQKVFPLELDLPKLGTQTSKSQRPTEDGTLIFLTLVVSSLRNTSKASARVKACDILLAFAEKLPDEEKLDRVLPFVMLLLNDRSDVVKVAAIKTLTQLLAMVEVVSPVNAYVFPEYIFPRLQPLIPGPNSNPSTIVRAAYASCIASLAQSSLRVLDMIQALRSDVRLMTLVPVGSEKGWTEEVSYHNLYDVARVDLLEFFEIHAKALLTDPDASVRRAFLGSVSSLCVFFGNPKANEVILSHLNTYLNDRDWILKCAFFEAVVGVAAYVGTTSLEEFVLPLMVQSMVDPEEFVVERVLRSLAKMARLGLLQRSTSWHLLNIAVRFFVHPSIWIREAAVHFVVESTTFMSAADKYCIITPLVRPFLKANTTDISAPQILDMLKKPLPKNVYEMLLRWATNVDKGVFWKAAARDGTFALNNSAGSNITKLRMRGGISLLSNTSRNDEDEQWLSKLRNIGMSQEDEFKLLALREYIWRVAVGQRVVDNNEVSRFTDIISLSQHNITPQTVLFDKKQGGKKTRPPSKTAEPSLGERKTHTIADALLDASTTIEMTNDTRQKHSRNRSYQQREDGVTSTPIRPSALKITRNGSPQAASPVSFSPNDQPGSLNSSAPPSDAEGTDIHNLNHAGRGRHDEREPGNATLQVPNSGVKRRSSAINLLSRQESSKAYAETATTSTNAFGKVDVPVQRGVPQTSATAAPQDSNNAAQPRLQYRANHTYHGNDPTILKLLDSVFAENYPTDLFDFGPVVPSVTARHPIKRANGSVSDKPWRPQGGLVAMFGEHTAPINRVVVAPDHAFFVTASDDGTSKVWDTTRLERNLTPRSRMTHRHSLGSKVKCVTFVENTHTFISAATDGSVQAVRVDYQNNNDAVRYGKPQVVREYKISYTDGSEEHAVWIEHFRTDVYSILLMATNRSRIIALDLKSMTEIYSLQIPVHHGTPTTFCIDRKRNWLLVGTSHGVLDLWDLRFCVRVKAWGLPGGTPVHRLVIHPTKGRGRWVCVSGGGCNGSDIMVWDIDKMQCREVYRASSQSTNPANPENDTPATVGQRNNNFQPDKSWKDYEPCIIGEDRPEGMLSRFAKITPPASAEMDPSASDDQPGVATDASASDRNGICALAAGLDYLEGNSDATRCGFLISAGADRKVRFWDLVRPDASVAVSGADLVQDGIPLKPRYDITHPTPLLVVTSEWIPSNGSPPRTSTGSNKKLVPSTGTGSSGRPPRSTVISLQQQQLLRSHLDSILDVAILEAPYGMTVSVDRAGMIYVFQ